ncbi:hypothetical protein M430DRAFT_32485 [Amorphotheca resinae ATCC 22711]|uniref:N-acetyltransferase domain-containing protein n=1 Tax=Amorphotheca resinae ATCC 22711 TaxID=857342 RepID=A0A2T3BEX4_AMORE|nr:hypothetical protein M430DRAFT_32485 [Amorphotheca resinae ATCC 22711]PSS27939.1 hypothetical protein M430DRAFT_32485 [Amorphotheca resinae ATCC 22711]
MASPAAPSSQRFTIRPAHLSDYQAIGELAATTYSHTPLTQFLAPYRVAHPRAYTRRFTQPALLRLLDARSLSFVAVETARPDVIVGYVQCKRLGSDAAAQELMRERESNLGRRCLRWLVWRWFRLRDRLVGGNRSEDGEAGLLFEGWNKRDERRYWEGFGERRNRWYVQSCVVRKEFQRLGIGRRLLGEVLRRAERENVVVGLESSEEGEALYRSLGFELLGRFEQDPYADFLGRGGGIFMWTPPAWKAKALEEKK